MNRLNTFFGLSLFLALAACGGENPDLFDDGEAEADGGELGELEQGITGKVTPTFQFGTRTSTNRQKCTRTSTGQACKVPTTVNLKVCSGNVAFISNNLSSFAAGRAAAMRSDLHGISGFAFNWPAASNNVVDGKCGFCFADGTCDPLAGQDANITIVKGPVGTSGTASNDIQNYAKVEFFKGNGNDNLTEASGVAGNYSSYQMCGITIDETDLLAKGTNAAQDQNLIDHAIVNSLLACAGFGRHPTATGTSSLYTRSVLNANIDVGAISNGEFCQANGYTLSSLNDYANNGTACTAD